MKRLFKQIGLMFLTICLVQGLYAEESIYIGDGDIASLKLYDSQGNPIDITSEQASLVGEGWILHNPDTPILLVTPRFSLNVYEGSLIVAGDLTSKDADFYLVSGKATVKSETADDLSLTIFTPVSRYKISGKGEVLIISTEKEESITSFSTTVQAYNSLSGFERIVYPFEKLGMQEPQAKAEPIEPGYYLTYATYPDMMLAKQLVQDLSKTKPVPTPLAPKANVTQLHIPTPTLRQVTIEPITPVVTSLQVADQRIFIPQAVQSIRVQVENPIIVPKPVTSLIAQVLSPPTGRIVVTVEALTPEPVTSIVSSSELQLPAAVSFSAPLILEEPSPAPVTVSEPVATLQPITAAVATPAPLAFSDDDTRITGSVGLEFSYRFQVDGTNSNALNNQVLIKPYFSKGAFSATLQASLSTEDFISFSNTITPFPTGSLATLSYGFSFIDQVRIGYSSSPFYLVLDHNRSLLSDYATYTTQQFSQTDKLVLQNQLKVGPLTLTTTFDDLYFTNLLADGKQFGSSLLQFTPSKGYPITIAVGALGAFDRNPWLLDLYPLLSFRLPIVNKRTTQINVLVQANGYLPVYPSIEVDQFIDTSVASIFPNYLLGFGFSVKHNSFSASIIASLNEGKNHQLLVNDFAYTIGTSYNSAFELFTSFGWESPSFKAKLLWNLPFTDSFALAQLSDSHQADFSQLTFSYTIKTVQIGLGFSYLGVLDTLHSVLDGTSDFNLLLTGNHATSYLVFTYEKRPLSIEAKAYYPVITGTPTLPLFSLTASIQMEKRF